MTSCAAECGSDDVPKLEANVVYALSRLGKTNNSKGTGGRGKVPGVSKQEIVDFLTENYQHLDGDIESQVMTALLSCVKIGFVCAQDNGKFRLLGANPRLMTSNCLTRYDHGAKCSCVTLMNAVTKIKPHNCCVLQASAKKSPKIVLKRASAVANRTGNKTKKKLTPRTAANCNASPLKKPKKGTGKSKCIQKMTIQVCDPKPTEGTSDSRLRKCNYCLRNHGKMKAGLKSCRKCYPRGIECNIPADKFSPREEVM